MTSTTETVIRAQFPFWPAVDEMALPEISAAQIVVLGCGTSFYLAQTIACAFNASGRAAVAVPGAEWTRRPQDYLADRRGALVIGLSRSGTTTETVQAIQAARAEGLATLAITCEPGSTILEAAETGIALTTDRREGIVMSVSASLMLLAGLRLAGVAPSAAEEAARVMALAETAGPLMQARHFVYLGAGPLYGMACEGGLKLMEMSISFSQAFHPLEYRHGPISLIDEGSVAVMLYGDDPGEEAKVVADIRAKGGRVIGFGGPGDLSIPLRSTGAARAAEVLPALQILGEMVAKAKGIDSDAPRHLTKVVTL